MTDTSPANRLRYAEILRIAIPLGIANLLLVANSFVDLLMIGQLGIDEMAGATLSIQLYLLLVVFGEGVVSAFTPLFAAARAKGDSSGQAKTLLASIILSLIIFVFAAVIMGVSSSILTIAGVQSDLTDLARSYGRVVAFSILPALISVIVWEIASVYDKAGWVTASSIVGFLSNIALNFFFISLGWGLPGIALATLISNCIVVICILIVVFPLIRGLLPLARDLAGALRQLPKLVSLGGPIGGIELATVGFFASSTYLMSTELPNVIAAHAIAYQVTELAIVLLLGFGEAATILVATAFGEDNWARVKRITLAITTSCLLVSALVCIGMIAVSQFIPVLFVGSGGDAMITRELATTFILIGASFTILDALQIAWLGILRGIQDTVIPMVVVMIGYWIIGVPSGILLARIFDFGPTGIWWGLTIGLAFTCLGLGWRIFRRLPRLLSDR